MEKRGSWGSRLTFILASVGSAVGLGNAWRFPGLAAKHGGGTFLLVYLVAMLVMGVPLFMMEIAISRKLRKGAVESMRGIHKKAEPIGWAATSNAFVIVSYYSIVFAWVILMFLNSWRFAFMTQDGEAASSMFFELTKTTGAIQGGDIPGAVLVCALLAWGLIFFCIRNGASSVSKVVKFTVFAPVMLLLIMAIKGCTMSGAGEGLAMLFIPDLTQLSDPTLWVDAIGQVFYSLSIMMAIMFAYGSYLGDDTNIVVDSLIISFSDMAVSILSGIVMFSTMGGTGMLDKITASGVATAFIVYPQAIVHLTSIGWLNAVFGAIFYLMLITLAIDSAFSIVEGISAAVSDKFHLPPKKVTIAVCSVAGVISLVYCSQAGLAWLDIVDNWTNQFNLILIGVLECLAVGWAFNLKKVHSEINRNTSKLKAPYWWIGSSVKVVSPILLIALFVWNIVVLFKDNGGSYGGYPIWAQVIAGWMVTGLVFLSGFIAKAVVSDMKKKGFVEDEIGWDKPVQTKQVSTKKTVRGENGSFK